MMLEEELVDLEERIRDSSIRKEQIEKKLRELLNTEKSNNRKHPYREDRKIMLGSILSVHIVNVDNITSGAGNEREVMVKVEIEKQRQYTGSHVSNGGNVVWNEILTFDISTGTDDLAIFVTDR